MLSVYSSQLIRRPAHHLAALTMVRAILIAPRIKHGHEHHVVLFCETAHSDDFLDQGRHIISHALRSRALQHDAAIRDQGSAHIACRLGLP